MRAYFNPLFFLMIFLALPAEADSRLDLRKLDAQPASVQITVSHDPVYKKARRFEGYALTALLQQLPGYNTALPAETLLLFTATDGYIPAIPLERALARRGVVAYRDLTATNGNWDPLKKGKGTPAPFYLVWEDSESQAYYPWVYKMVALSLVPKQHYYAPMYPREPAQLPGFHLFVKHCHACHSLNLRGGTLGPELNVPRNITEYWALRHLRDFIRNPAAYRARSKMPGHNFFSDSQLDMLLGYIEHMKTVKICSNDCS